MTALLRLAGVSCARGGRLLFEGLDLTLAAGDAALVTGPNGAGKSSLLRLAAGLLRPTAGTVERAAAALAGGAAALDPELPLARALGFWWRLDGVDAAAGEAAMEALGLADLAEVPVAMLSTGQRQRAGLARAFAGPARLWLLDEPANGLDAASLAAVERGLAAHRAGGGAAVVATHIPVALPGAATIRLGAA